MTRLPAAVETPRYRRDDLRPGVVHIGVGNFHRAHQALYFERLADRGVTDWGITGVGLGAGIVRHGLWRQDGLFTVVEREGADSRARVVGALPQYLYGPDDAGAVLDVLCAPSTRLVTLTLTGNGYPYDAQGRPNPGTAAGRSTRGMRDWGPFDYLVAALAHRRARSQPPFTVLSCDNLPASGASARACTLAVAAERDPLLARWIESHVSFPNAMVDRIAPVTTDDHRRLVQQAYGVVDLVPVVTEPFSQWVIQDDFSTERPPLDLVGAQFVPDVAPFKLLKTRLLNGGHCALGYLGTLMGYRTSDEAMLDPTVKSHLRLLMRHEVLPLLPPTPGVDVKDYRRTLLHRFGNASVADPLSRLCGRGSTKMPAYLLPSLHEAIEQQRPHVLLTLTVAAWMRYLRGYDLQGQPLRIEDQHAAELTRLARTGGCDPRPLLSVTDIFGDLRRNERFVGLLGIMLEALDRGGVRTVIRSYRKLGPSAISGWYPRDRHDQGEGPHAEVS